MSVYNKILDLCSLKGITISKLCEDIGLYRSTASSWKRGSIPSDITIHKIADYFKIPAECFREDDEDKINRMQFENDVKMELFGTIDVPDEVYSEVKDISKFLLYRYNSKNGGKVEK